MIAVDTNVVIRYLIGDHPEQSAKARALIDNQDTFISITVLLEAEWVLRSTYGQKKTELAKGLRRLGGLVHATIEESPLVAQALDWMEDGMDFADALHLARTANCDAFVTFDQRLLKAANQLSGIKVRIP